MNLLVGIVVEVISNVAVAERLVEEFQLVESEAWAVSEWVGFWGSKLADVCKGSICWEQGFVSAKNTFKLPKVDLS